MSKLHATLTNENGTIVSKGGNEWLTINLNIGNKKTATVELTDQNIKIWYNNGHYWGAEIEKGTTQNDKIEIARKKHLKHIEKDIKCPYCHI